MPFQMRPIRMVILDKKKSLRVYTKPCNVFWYFHLNTPSKFDIYKIAFCVLKIGEKFNISCHKKTNIYFYFLLF